MNAEGVTVHYDVRSDVSKVNYVASISQTILENQNGYALVGYRDGAIWLEEKAPSTVSVVPAAVR